MKVSGLPSGKWNCLKRRLPSPQNSHELESGSGNLGVLEIQGLWASWVPGLGLAVGVEDWDQLFLGEVNLPGLNYRLLLLGQISSLTPGDIQDLIPQWVCRRFLHGSSAVEHLKSPSYDHRLEIHMGTDRRHLIICPTQCLCLQVWAVNTIRAWKETRSPLMALIQSTRVWQVSSMTKAGCKVGLARENKVLEKISNRLS